jgi:glycerate kinase
MIVLTPSPTVDGCRRIDERLSSADLAITGAGALDEQSLHGKEPA